VNWVTINTHRAAFPPRGRCAKRSLISAVTPAIGEADMRQSTIRPFLFGTAAVLVAASAFAGPAQAASVDTRFDVCAALRNGTSLAAIEATLEARGYSASNAGALTGTTIRQQCPDQAANAISQAQRAGA
jgi:hypothetical protein